MNVKKINYDDFIKEKRKKYFDVPARLGRRRAARRKPRNREERDALMRQDYERYKKWIDNGDLVIINPRK